MINAQGTTQYDYFRDSQLKTVTYPNNIRSRYTYDTAGRVDTIINTQNSPGGVLLFRIQHRRCGGSVAFWLIKSIG